MRHIKIDYWNNAKFPSIPYGQFRFWRIVSFRGKFLREGYTELDNVYCYCL